MLEDTFFAEKPSYKGLFQLRRLLYDGTVNTQLSECVGSAFQQDLKKSVTLITPKTSLLESFCGKDNLIAVRYSEKNPDKYYVRVTRFIDMGDFFQLICEFPSNTNWNLEEWKSYSPDGNSKTSEQDNIVAFTFWEKNVIKLYFMNKIVKKVENAGFIPPSAVGATIFEDGKNKKAIGMVTRDSNGGLIPKLFTTEDISKLTTGNGEKKQTTETDEEQPSTSYETDCGKPIQDNMPHTQQAYHARHKQDTSYTAKESKIKAGQMQTEGERMRAKGSGICLRQQLLADTVELIPLIKKDLDTDSHFGGDYKSLAGALGYRFADINYFKSLQGKQSPTEVLLTEMKDITVEELMEKLKQIKNKVALDKVKKWLEQCECDVCKVE